MLYAVFWLRDDNICSTTILSSRNSRRAFIMISKLLILMVEPADTFLIKIQVQKQSKSDTDFVQLLMFTTLFAVSLTLAILYKYLTRPNKQFIALRFEESANEEV